MINNRLSIVKVLAVVAFAALAGCSDPAADGTQSSSENCGDGDSVTALGHDACVFGAELIIEGFMCPDHVSFSYDLPNGGLVCIDTGGVPQKDVTSIYEQWQGSNDGVDGMSATDGTPGTDGTDGIPGVDGLTALDGTSDGTDGMEGTDGMDAAEGTDGLDGTDSTDGTDGMEGTDGVDATDAIDGTDGQDGAWPQEAPPYPNAAAPWCVQMHDQPIGEQIIVIDWQCPVAEQCADGGVIAQCNPDVGVGDVWYCNCDVFGQECYPINNLASCPDPNAAEGEACDVQIAESCGAGLFCELDPNEPDPEVYPFENTKGLCKPLPICSGGIACYDNSECQDGHTCRDADPAKGMPGTCREPTVAPTCLVDSDCPQGWECAGETLGCDHACECSDPTAPDTVGQCIKENGFSDPTIWVADTVFWSGQPIAPYWTKGDIGENSDWITCPSYDIEAQDSKTQSWYKLGQESCGDNEAGLVELTPGSFIPVAPFTVTADADTDYTSVRLVARYYNGCENAQSPLTCEGGPYEKFFQPIFVIPVDAPTE